MKVVLSIKPQFANKIFDGTKKFEFRKAIFKKQNVTSVLVYASSPVQKVIGEFEIGEIFNFDLKTLWDKTKEYSGITEDYFYEYFENRDQGFAIQIKNQIRFTNPKCLKEDYNLTPPQSFAYWNSKE